MGQLKNPRHEAFAQLRALERLQPFEAYKRIGGKGKRNQAWKINQRPEVKARIAELMDEEKVARIQQQLTTKDMVTKGLLENIESAKRGVKLYKGEIVKDETGEPIRDVDHGAINTAWNMLGVDLGMFVRESKVRHLDDDSLERLTLDELLEHTQRVLWETSDGQLDLDLDDLRRALANAAERDPEDPDAQDGALQALSEAAGLSQAGSEEA